ncbi:8-oxo-dGTP diphosphatase [Atopobacter sp. AH10]|uniref:NUDIX hydrolase n=1 Tax=Atopobacter sp. AH10 TaxID=2315861 RepID=UPI000EF1A8AE|nr:8-oxo-dGTP diphosphatase [Atopobacter sp. AH10]RLK62588.1 8-oxo-dGTP diphosphatase [Atopobacter sp. AH10]
MAKLSTLIYLEREGKFLMMLRNKKKVDINANKWLGVGGKVEAGESPYQAALREVYEETGYVVDDLKARGIITFLYDQDEALYIFLYTGRAKEGDPCVCDEGELHYIEKEKILDLDLWEGDRVFLKRLLENDPRFMDIRLVYDKEDRLLAVEERC